MTLHRLFKATLSTTLVAGLAVAMTAGTSSLALAQGTAASPKKELVQKILLLQQGAVDNLARGLAEQSIVPVAQQAMTVLHSRVPPEQREATAREIQADIKKYGDEVVPLLRERGSKLAASTVGALLEERLSEDELKQVIAMIEAPIYLKYQQLGAEMQRALLEKLVADTRSVVEPKLTALQDSVGKRLGLPPRPAASAVPAASAKPATASAKPGAANASAARK